MIVKKASMGSRVSPDLSRQEPEAVKTLIALAGSPLSVVGVFGQIAHEIKERLRLADK
jgi:hypothetical protein